MLIRALHDPDVEVRIAAEAVPELHEARVSDKSRHVRDACVLALAFTGVQDAGDQLLDAFAKLKKFSERAACALALGRIGDPAPISRFFRFAEDYNIYCVSRTLELVATIP